MFTPLVKIYARDMPKMPGTVLNSIMDVDADNLALRIDEQVSVTVIHNSLIIGPEFHHAQFLPGHNKKCNGNRGPITSFIRRNVARTKTRCQPSTFRFRGNNSAGDFACEKIALCVWFEEV